MTTVVLVLITVVAAATLIGVLWSVMRVLVAERANSRLRRDGVMTTGTVIDNTMTSTAQRRLLFAPVVAFQTVTGQAISAPAQQQSATSWARGSTVQVCYDPATPETFVLAGPTSRSHIVANVVVGAIVVAIMAGAILAMHHVWSEFRYDRAGRPDSYPGFGFTHDREPV
jgi:Protein of unknown function (DUF3592)